MSGHSKWSKIKRQKGSQDQKRGAVFSKLVKALSIAAREGKDPEMNFKLKLAMDQARSANMPSNTIERAILRGAGELEGQNQSASSADPLMRQIDEVIYEAYGPGGVALLIQTATDNRNRTTSDLRHILSKHQGALAETGAVVWNFEQKGVIALKIKNETCLIGSPPKRRTSPPKRRNKEEIELKAIDAGAEDIKEQEEALIIYTKPKDLQKVKNAIACDVEYAGLEFVPKNKVELPDKDKARVQKLIEELEDNEDAGEVWSNLG